MYCHATNQASQIHPYTQNKSWENSPAILDYSFNNCTCHSYRSVIESHGIWHIYYKYKKRTCYKQQKRSLRCCLPFEFHSYLHWSCHHWLDQRHVPAYIYINNTGNFTLPTFAGKQKKRCGGSFPFIWIISELFPFYMCIIICSWRVY